MNLLLKADGTFVVDLPSTSRLAVQRAQETVPDIATLDLIMLNLIVRAIDGYMALSPVRATAPHV